MIMNFAELLHQRDGLLQQARLANLAFAHERLAEYAHRLGRAGLSGAITVQPADPAAEIGWPTLVAPDIAPAVLDEHFLDEDAVELDELLEFLRAEGVAVQDTICRADIEGRLLPWVGRELARHGVRVPSRSVPRAGLRPEAASPQPGEGAASGD